MTTPKSNCWPRGKTKKRKKIAMNRLTNIQRRRQNWSGSDGQGREQDRHQSDSEEWKNGRLHDGPISRPIQHHRRDSAHFSNRKRRVDSSPLFFRITWNNRMSRGDNDSSSTGMMKPLDCWDDTHTSVTGRARGVVASGRVCVCRG